MIRPRVFSAMAYARVKDAAASGVFSQAQLEAPTLPRFCVRWMISGLTVANSQRVGWFSAGFGETVFSVKTTASVEYVAR